MTDPREKILAHACELYLSDGLTGLSMRRLAREVGVTAPALYRHYEGKEAVLADVVREAHRAFLGYLTRALEERTPWERFARAGGGFLDFALEHPRWFTMLASGADRLGMEALPEDIEAMGCAIHQFWIDRVRECQAAGILEGGDPAELSLTMWAHAFGMVQLYHQGHFRMGEPEFRKLFAESSFRLMAGIATEAFTREVGCDAHGGAAPAQSELDEHSARPRDADHLR